MEDYHDKARFQINIQNAELSGNASVVKIENNDTQFIRESYLRLLTRDQTKTTIPLGFPDIKGSDPSQSSGMLGLKSVFIGPKTQTKFTITRTELFLGIEAAGIAASFSSVIEDSLGLHPTTPENIKIINDFAEYLSKRITDEVQENRIFENADNLIFETAASIFEVVRFISHLVILGSPGSGKTTFINYLVSSIAARQFDKEDLETTEYSNLGQKHLFPIPVSLREYVKEIERNEEQADLIRFAAKQYENVINTDGLEKIFRSEINACRALLLLDGLDEVPPKYRIRVKKDIELIELCSDSRIIVTCRILSYQDDRWKLDPKVFGVVTLSPFDDKQINDFLTVFYKEVAKKGYNTVRPVLELENEIKQLVARPDIHRLATNPLLLTIIALVHTTRGELANSRSLLYEDAVEWLLTRWTLKSHRTEKSIRKMLEDEDVGSSINELEEILRKIAFDIHGTTESLAETASITDNVLTSYLRELHPARNLPKSKFWAMELIEAIKEQAGLLVATEVRDNSDIYAFPHRTFQEYLAARHIVSQESFSDIINLVGRKDIIWHEVVLFAVGYKGLKDGIDSPISAASKLCSRKNDHEFSDDDWKASILAGEIILEIGLSRAKKSGRDDELKRIIDRLNSLVEHGRLSVLERNTAGNILSSLGDPRKGVTDENGIPDIFWIDIPEGPFIITETEKALIHNKDIKSFRISKYPITNAQYFTCVKAGVLHPPQHWNANAPPQDILNHPVVHVSWIDASKFCDWFSSLMGFEIRLPTANEWTKAARGINDARPWPWGNIAEYHRANVGLTGIRETSAVGRFPLGDLDPWCHLLDGGPQDMSGNVNEWCLDLFSSEDQNKNDLETPRKVRGGSYRGGLDVAKCLPLNTWRVPQNTHPDVGFRVIAPRN